MKSDEMIKHAKSVVDNVTELVARVTAIQRQLDSASHALDDFATEMAAILRIENDNLCLAEIAAAMRRNESRRRELEAGLRQVRDTLTEPRFLPMAADEARIELDKLLSKTETDA